MINWNLVISILTALGIFEAIKTIIMFMVVNNFIKKNLEIREISERALKILVELKNSQFTKPLDEETKKTLYLDVHKIMDLDQELSRDFMMMINMPVMIETLRTNDSRSGFNQNTKVILDFQHKMLDKSDKLVPKLNKLRYKPIIDFNPSIPNILTTLRNRFATPSRKKP